MSDSRSEVRGFDSPYDLWEFLQPKFDAECGLRYKYYESITKNPQLILFRRLSPKTTLKKYDFLKTKMFLRCVPYCSWVIESPLFSPTFRIFSRLYENVCPDEFACLVLSLRPFECRPTYMKMRILTKFVIF